MLGMMLAVPMQSQAQECEKKTAKSKSECTTVKGDLAKATFEVDGRCGMCEDRIETAAKEVKGVKDASWDVESHKLALEFDKENVDVKKVHKAIAEAGHDTEKMKATEKTYASLPNCCNYRED